MKVLQVLLLTAMVAIAMEKCVAEYLLVEIEDGKFDLFSYICCIDR